MNFISNIGYDTAFLALFAIIGLTVILRFPQAILYLLIPSTILPKYFNQVITIGHVNIFVHDCFLFFYCACAGVLILAKFIKKKQIFDLDSATKPLFFLASSYLLLHLFYVVISLVQGVSPATAIRRFLIYSDILYFYFPILFLSDESQYKNLLKFMIIMVIFGFLHQLYVAAIATRFHNLTSSGTVRIGLNGITIIGSCFFAFIVFKNDLKYYLIAICPIISIILVGHRSGFIAIAASLIVFFIFTKKITKLLLLCYLFGFLLLISLGGLEFLTGHDFLEDTLTRTGDTFSTSNKTSIGRLNKIENSFQVFIKKPIFGFGHNYESIKGLANKYPYGLNDQEYLKDFEFNVLHPHCLLARSLSHTGIFGTLILSSIIILALKRCHLLIGAGESYSTKGVFIYCSIIYFVVFSLFNTTFTEEGWFFWTLCGSVVYFSKNIESAVGNNVPEINAI